jgi:hypothetical protein
MHTYSPSQLVSVLSAMASYPPGEGEPASMSGWHPGRLFLYDFITHSAPRGVLTEWSGRQAAQVLWAFSRFRCTRDAVTWSTPAHACFMLQMLNITSLRCCWCTSHSEVAVCSVPPYACCPTPWNMCASHSRRSVGQHAVHDTASNASCLSRYLLTHLPAGIFQTGPTSWPCCHTCRRS